jgi:hypothetical protein
MPHIFLRTSFRVTGSKDLSTLETAIHYEYRVVYPGRCFPLGSPPGEKRKCGWCWRPIPDRPAYIGPEDSEVSEVAIASETAIDSRVANSLARERSKAC